MMMASGRTIVMIDRRGPLGGGPKRCEGRTIVL
jgi:hypothetical protein